MSYFYFILIFYKDLQKSMTSDINSNGVLTRKEKEDFVLDLYFNQNKTYSEIAKIVKYLLEISNPL
jgi:DNA-directed RNA polymerase specialized sigma subunit